MQGEKSKPFSFDSSFTSEKCSTETYLGEVKPVNTMKLEIGHQCKAKLLAFCGVFGLFAKNKSLGLSIGSSYTSSRWSG